MGSPDPQWNTVPGPVRAFHSSFHAGVCSVGVNSYSGSPVLFTQGLELDGPVCILPQSRVRMAQSVDGTFAPIPDVLQ